MDKIPYNKQIKYKELIKSFGLEYKEGGARTTQLKKLFREYNIKKCGTYYIIEEELTQLEKLLVKTKPKFQDYIVPLIYSYMHNGIYSDAIIKPKGNILKDLAMINDNFYAVREDPYKYALLLDDNLDGDNLLRYTEEVYRMLCNALDSACYEIADRKLAHVEKVKMMLQIFPKLDGTEIKKAIPLNDSQLKQLTKIQNDYMEEHLDKNGKPYALWSKIPYMELRFASKWVSDKLGYSTFDGYKFLVNETGIEKYIARNFPEMKQALSTLVEHKITNSKRKHIGNLSKDTRIILTRELHSNNNQLDLKPKKTKESTNVQ